MTVAEKIKSLRKVNGLTQTELGDRLGVKKNAVSKWECGRVEDIPVSKLKMMAELFDVSPSYFIDDDVAPTAPVDMESTLKAAFFGGYADDLTEEQIDELWDDAKCFFSYKIDQLKNKNKKNDKQ